MTKEIKSVDAWRDECEALRRGLSIQNYVICQILGKALGYPWYMHDQKNFPGATEADGVCVGDHTAESIAAEAAARITAAPRATAETVRVAVLSSNDGWIGYAIPDSQQEQTLLKHREYRRLGTTTLQLDTEARG